MLVMSRAKPMTFVHRLTGQQKSIVFHHLLSVWTFDELKKLSRGFWIF
jgi:hypothetical protein